MSEIEISETVKGSRGVPS